MKMEAQIRLVNVEDIIPNRFQPRLEFNEEALNQLAASIKSHGIIQPLVLRRVAGKFEIIAGERRYKASKIIGLTQVPAIITNLDDNESAEVSIIENTHRKNMSAIEEAQAYKKLLDRRYVTQDQLASRLGISQSTVANKIRLLNLDPSVQDALLKEKISERHARSLLKLTDKLKQVELLNKTINERWPVRKLDEEIDNILGVYKNKVDVTGAIKSNRDDSYLINMMNNAEDINFANDEPEIANYQYQGGRANPSKDKKQLFFNSLEDESVNMNPNTSFGFNPFETEQIKTADFKDELDSSTDIDDTGNKKIENEEVLAEQVNSVESTIRAIEKLKKLALENDIKLELEEFNFDKMHQFIIRIEKDEE